MHMIEKLKLVIFVFSFILTVTAGWKPRQQYTFSVTGRNIAGMPQLKQQYTGIDFKGKVLLQSHDLSIMLVKFFDMSYAKLHGELPNWWSDSEVQNQTRELPLTLSAVVIQMKKDGIEKMVVPQNTSDWELNFIKGIIYQLMPNVKLNIESENINLVRNESNDIKMFSTEKKRSSYYTTMEDSVTGRCEVMYSINKIPYESGRLENIWNHPMKSSLCLTKNVYEITRTHNFNKCDFLSETHHAFPFIDGNDDCNPGSNACGNIWERSSVTRMVGCSNSYGLTLLESVTSSSVSANIQSLAGSQTVVNSNLNLTLIKVEPELPGSFTDILPRKPKHVLDFLYMYTKRLQDSSSASQSSYSESTVMNDDPLSHYDKVTPHENRFQDNKEKNYNKNQVVNNHKTKKTKLNKKVIYNNSEDFYPISSIHNPEKKDVPKNPWNITSSGMNFPPHHPFTPFSLAHGEGELRNCLSLIFKDLIEQISFDFISKDVLVEGVMEKISRAVDMCQMLSFRELFEISDNLFYSHTINNTFSEMAATKRNLFRDLIAVCGTKPALVILNQWVEKKQLDDYESAVIFSTLPARLMYGDKEILNYYFSMMKKISNNANEYLASAAIIGFSNFVRISCTDKNYKKNYFNPKLINSCESKDAENYVNWMSKNLKEDDRKLLKVFIVAIGNTGSKSAIKILKTVVDNSFLPSYHRSSAVYAMKYLAFYYPSEMAPILFNIYSNYSNPVSVRVSGVSTLIFSKPSITMWQRIAISTWYEPNPAVTSFIQNTIISLTVTDKQNPVSYKDIAHTASFVKHLIKPQHGSYHKDYVYNILDSVYVKETESAIFQQSSWGGFADVMNIYHRRGTHSSTFSTNYEADLSVANPDDLLSVFRSLFISSSGNITQARPPIENLKRSTKWIHNILGIIPRKPSSMEGDLRIKINNLIETIIPFDRKSSASFSNWRESIMKHVTQEGFKRHFLKTDVFSTALSTTTELGFPVRLQLRTPWFLHGNTFMKAFDDYLNVTFSFRFSSAMNGEFGFYTPWDKTVYSTGILSTYIMQLPKIQFSMNYDTSPLSYMIKITETPESSLFYHSTYPFTSQRDLVSNWLIRSNEDTQIIHVAPLKQVNISVCHLDIIYETEGKMLYGLDILNQLKFAHPIMLYPNRFTQIEIKMLKLDPVSFNFLPEKVEVDEGGFITTKSDETDIENEIENSNQVPQERRSRNSIFSFLFGDSETKTTESSVTTDTYLQQTAITSPSEEYSTTTTLKPIIKDTIESQTASQHRLAYKRKSVGDIELKNSTFENNGEFFNASFMDPFNYNLNGSSHLYLADKVLNGIESGKAVVLGVNIIIHKPDSESHKYSSYWTYGSTLENTLQRIGVFMAENNNTWKCGLTASLEMLPTGAFNIEEIIMDRTQPKFDIDFIHQWDNQNKTMSIKTASYNMMLNNIADFFMTFGREYIEEQHSRLSDFSNNENYPTADSSASSMVPVQVSVSVNKKMLQWHSWFNTTAINVRYSGMPIYLSPVISTAFTLYEEAIQINSEYCKISKSKIFTFDSLYLYYNMSDCWHVAVKDCSGKSRIVILTRSLKNSTYMDIEINLDNYKIIRFSEQGIHINDQPLKVSPGITAVVYDKSETVLTHIKQTINYMFDITLPAHGFQITYSNSSVVIYAYSGMQKRLRGLCGDYDLETFGELSSPKGVVLNSAYEFGSSYSLNDEECSQIN
ncbi:vitellogenin-like isoform X2 [Lycorma delicatula]|uniref:vitellogenin-like isoform X2 n=1 Tax=Lycorma delicatula TaxID=130591 RepID=UPI003F5178C0